MQAFQPERISGEGCSEAQSPPGFQNAPPCRPFSATHLNRRTLSTPHSVRLKSDDKSAHFDCLFMGKSENHGFQRKIAE